MGEDRVYRGKWDNTETGQLLLSQIQLVSRAIFISVKTGMILTAVSNTAG